MNRRERRSLGVSRRAFLGRAAGAGTVLGTGLLSPEVLVAREDDDHGHRSGGRPNPIPFGLTPFKPFAIFIHHLPPAQGMPLTKINELSSITDFKGFVGFTRIRGGGVGTNTNTGASQDLTYQVDMGFNQGTFVGTDGRRHEGTFAFVWLDVYAGPVGQANLAQQVHDYNVHIDENDVFWTVPLAHDAVEVDFDDARARLRVNGLEAFDDHDLANSLTYGLGLPGGLGYPYPKIDGVQPVRARLSFDIEWSGLQDSAEIRNATQGFEGSFLKTGATIRWSSEQDGFRFQSEEPNPARNLFAVIGRERNGVFFT